MKTKHEDFKAAKVMKQKDFFTILQNNKRMQRKLQGAVLKGGEWLFYFTLGGIFYDLNISGWDSDTFIDKVCKVCNMNSKKLND